MSQMPASGKKTVDLSLYRYEEEDLVDYDDSDFEIETGDNKRSSTLETNEENQLDIYSTDATQPDQPTHEASPKEEEPEVTEAHNKNVGVSTSTATKTPQAAALIKALQDMLTNSAFRTSLGLIESGSTVDLSIWASGLDFTLTLRLVGAAEVKACKYGAECHNAKCTFDHGSADRTATIAAEKPRKLCSMINTPTSCPKGIDCWYSHVALGVVCAHGDRRATCPKGPYCFYKHNDDEAVAPAEPVEQPPTQIENTVQIKETEATAQTTTSVEESSTPAPSATGAAISPKQQATSEQEVVSKEQAVPKQPEAGRKRSRKSEEDIEDRTSKVQRIQKHQDRQDGSYGEHAQSDNPRNGRRGSGHRRRSDRGRGRKGERGGSYRPSAGSQHSGKEGGSKGALSSRITRD